MRASGESYADVLPASSPPQIEHWLGQGLWRPIYDRTMLAYALSESERARARAACSRVLVEVGEGEPAQSAHLATILVAAAPAADSRAASGQPLYRLPLLSIRPESACGR